MSSQPVSRRLEALIPPMTPLLNFLNFSEWAKRKDEPDIADLVGGSPQEPPPDGFVEAIQRWTVPQKNDWYAYKLSDPSAQSAVAEVLRERRGVAYQPDDVFMTTGAFGGLALALRAVVDPDDEVILPTPPWHFYDILIRYAGAVPVRVPLGHPACTSTWGANSSGPRWDLDVAAIEAAITPRTRAVIINAPHNPTGRIYPAEALQALANVLEGATKRHGRAIYLISDESFCRLVFDGRTHVSPAAHYARSFLVYTYGKTLLTPGMRLGYIALHPDMPDKAQVRVALSVVQTGAGYAYPDTNLQYAVRDLEALTTDVGHMQKKRDRLCRELRMWGYDPFVPEATFWVLVRSPIPDDVAFAQRLARFGVFVMPGSLLELPGFLRLSLTASDEMIDRSFYGIALAISQVQGRPREAATG